MTNTATDARRHNFFIVDNEAVDNYNLNPYEGWLYIVIVRHVNKQTGVAFPSLDTLAKKTNMSEPTVVKYLKNLEEKGLVRIEQQFEQDKKAHKANHYHILEVVKEINQGGKADLPGVVKEVKTNKTKPNNTTSKKKKSVAKPPQPTPEQPSIKFDYDKPIGPEPCKPKDIVDAWYNAMPAPPIKRKYPRNVVTAKRIQDNGFTYDQVFRLTQAKYQTGRTTQVKLEWIEDDLPQWVAAGEPTNDQRPAQHRTPGRTGQPTHNGRGFTRTAPRSDDGASAAGAERTAAFKRRQARYQPDTDLCSRVQAETDTGLAPTGTDGR